MNADERLQVTDILRAVVIQLGRLQNDLAALSQELSQLRQGMARLRNDLL